MKKKREKAVVTEGDRLYTCNRIKIPGQVQREKKEHLTFLTEREKERTVCGVREKGRQKEETCPPTKQRRKRLRKRPREIPKKERKKKKRLCLREEEWTEG